MAQRSAGAPEGASFIDFLLSCKDERGAALSVADVQEEVDTFIFEGHDTTAAALTFATHLLATHPHVQTRLFAEVAAEKDEEKMSLLEGVLKEALRLYPPVPWLGRVLDAPTQTRGGVVPAGVQVLR